MKWLMTALLAAAPAFALEGPSLSGKWQLYLSVSGYDVNMECTFSHEGEAVSGRCASDNGTVEVKGKTDGKSIHWTFASEGGGEKHDVILKGVIESATKIRGGVEVPAYGVEGEFTATKKE
ncbi:MAG: hypothetical protein N2036_00220 [Bryobacteraceae bacterium]|nr:hypothetical protein [Bryobacteraceae bacterium]MCX7602475.1 hypothetical protein [Bryobacteraceae bacterium]